jgi:DNA-binding CsgD family transcriptional regulator
MAAAQRGDLAIAEEALRDGLAKGPAITIYGHELLVARAWLAGGQGDLAAARVLIEEAVARTAAAGATLLEMLALLDLARLGSPGSATVRLDELAREVDGGYGAAAAVYARAASDGDGDGLDDVSASFEAMGALLLAAEAAADAARAHRAAGRVGDHVNSLIRAEALAASCDGARTPALEEMRSSSVMAALSHREREVMELAAIGLSNKEIAGHLYVSVRTVNSHLNHAFRKLGTSDRRLLAAARRSTIGAPSGNGHGDSAPPASGSAPSATEIGTPRADR